MYYYNCLHFSSTIDKISLSLINWEIPWKASCVFITDDKLHTSWPIILKIILRHILHKKNNTYQVRLVSLLWFLYVRKSVWPASNTKRTFISSWFEHCFVCNGSLLNREHCSGPDSSTGVSATVLVRFSRLRLRQFWFDFHVVRSATVLVRLSRQPNHHMWRSG